MEAAEDALDRFLDLAPEVDVEEAVDDGVDGVVDKDAVGADLEDRPGNASLVAVKVFYHAPDYHHRKGREVAQKRKPP